MTIRTVLLLPKKKSYITDFLIMIFWLLYKFLNSFLTTFACEGRRGFLLTHIIKNPTSGLVFRLLISIPIFLAKTPEPPILKKNMEIVVFERQKIKKNAPTSPTLLQT